MVSWKGTEAKGGLPGFRNFLLNLAQVDQGRKDRDVLVTLVSPSYTPFPLCQFTVIRFYTNPMWAMHQVLAFVGKREGVMS